jgi:uncharacterized cupin superfamily protein
MKIRRGNNNKGNPSLVIGISKEVKQSLKLEAGDYVVWKQNAQGKWEIIKLEVDEHEN